MKKRVYSDKFYISYDETVIERARLLDFLLNIGLKDNLFNDIYNYVNKVVCDSVRKEANSENIMIVNLLLNEEGKEYVSFEFFDIKADGVGRDAHLDEESGRYYIEIDVEGDEVVDEKSS